MAAEGMAWNGSASQEDFMKRDEVILVDEQDRMTGSDSKHKAHTFNSEQPRGLLHRAFSVFLFDDDNQLLLQRRANSKITFPGVWTNTCCSHQLHGYEPSEIDSDAEVSSGFVPGAKRAAVRKLGHELGIPKGQLPMEAFKYLTRLHYCAADTDTYGPNAEWGEHEIDYILFVKARVSLEPNMDEVEEARYVTEVELQQMMKPDSGLKWSPWFRIIAERFLHRWWQDLGQTIGSDDHVDLARIHKVL
ncbi:hypothetical protein CVIRNUC_005928 [Coccomyxa viridis]|uniref:isopentenyl-diphosphate Delta-isomerase n=1 Tax=Coccomyxa viridis TaxID=1274662 RepID=A0AAV1I5V7_9CHLO|nr:hypothetical protein CVIRNUC_005928 [Coccomyxa viridis]